MGSFRRASLALALASMSAACAHRSTGAIDCGRAKLAWSSRVSRLSADRFGRVFDDDLELSRLDLRTGRKAWTVMGYVRANDEGGECAFPEVVLGRSNERLVGIAATDGAIRWKIDTTHLVDNSGQYESYQLACPIDASSGQFFIRYRDHQSFDAYSIATGQRLWRYTRPGTFVSAQLLGIAKGVAIVGFTKGVTQQGAHDGSMTLDALDLATGQRRWTELLPGVESEIVVTDDGALLEVEAGAVRRLDADTGATRWTRRGKRIPSTSGLYLGGPDGLVRLDAERGLPLWTSKSLDDVRVFSHGLLVGTRCDDKAVACELLALQAEDGALRWRRAFPKDHYLDADEAGHLIEADDKSIWLLDDTSGRPRWSYRYRRGSYTALERQPAADQCNVYLYVGDINYKFPIWDSVALDVFTGARRWRRHWSSLVLEDADRIYILEGGYTGTDPYAKSRPFRLYALWRQR